VDGSDPAANNTTCVPCKTIQGALNLAGPGASIAVVPGTYHETLTITQSVSIIGGVARLPGEQGPTIVDAGGTGSVVTIPNELGSVHWGDGVCAQSRASARVAGPRQPYRHGNKTRATLSRNAAINALLPRGHRCTYR
jgi:hypothetical protein